MNLKGRNIKFHLAIILPQLIFLLIGIGRIITYFPQYDDAYNATISKNLANGFGYTSSFDVLIPFNPEVTTGPTLILPAALFIKIFGTNYWIPAFTTLLLSSILIYFIIKVLSDYLQDRSKFSGNNIIGLNYLLLISFFICLFWIPEARSIAFLGEFPAALFVCFGAVILFKPGRKLSTIVWGGFFLGLSITTKQISVVLLVPIFLIWSGFLFIDEVGKEKFVNVITKEFLLIICIALPSLLFELYKLSTLGFTQYLNLKHVETEFFKMQGSGINQIIGSPNLLHYAINNFKNNILLLLKVRDGVFRLFIFLLTSVVLIVKSIRQLTTKKQINSIERLALGLIFSVLALMLWWLLVSFQGWYRTVSPAIDIAAFSIIISIIAIFTKREIPVLFLIILLWIIFSPKNWIAYFTIPKIPIESILSTERTANYLSTLKSEGKELLGCGWWANRRLEFFMPQTLNFSNCFSKDLRDSILVIDSDYWNWGYSEEIMKVEQQCPHLLYDNPPYQVFQCR
jgi:hypothetical protein